MHKRVKPRNLAVISIISGFGNNLFQLAAAHEMEKRGFRVMFDVSNVKKRHLEIFEIPEIYEYVNPRILRISRYCPSIIGKHSRFLRFPLKYVFGVNLWIDMTSVGKLPDKTGQNYLITGFWQRLTVAKHLPEISYFQRTTVPRKVALHVRRGDMVSNVQSPMDEYFKSCVLSILMENPGVDLSFFVYTDDSDYCLNNLDIGVAFKVILGGSTLDDFLGLIEAEYLVLSRSSYSWWAGFFSKGKVYAPLPWNPTMVQNDRLVFPGDWLTLNCS
jgi:hypothetical protein